VHVGAADTTGTANVLEKEKQCRVRDVLPTQSARWRQPQHNEEN